MAQTEGPIHLTLLNTFPSPDQQASDSPDPNLDMHSKQRRQLPTNKNFK